MFRLLEQKKRNAHLECEKLPMYDALPKAVVHPPRPAGAEAESSCAALLQLFMTPSDPGEVNRVLNPLSTLQLGLEFQCYIYMSCWHGFVVVTAWKEATETCPGTVQNIGKQKNEGY